MKKSKIRRAQLNKTEIDKLKPAATYYEVNDTKKPGLLLRIQPTGTKVFYIRYKAGGKVRYFRLGNATQATVDEFRIAAEQHLASVVKGADPMEEKQRPKDHTLESFLEVYEKDAPRKKAAAANIVRVKRSFKDLLEKPLADIRPMWVQGWQRKREEAGAAMATVNREVTALRAVLGWAVDWGYLQAHPLKRVKQYKVDTGTRPRYLKPEELKQFHAALDAREEERRVNRDNYNAHQEKRAARNILPSLRAVDYTDYLKPLTLLALNTGLRRGELFNLTWSDVDLEGAVLTVQGSGAKSGKTRYIPMNRTALDALTKWKAQGLGVGLVFTSPKNGKRFDNINSAWDKLTDKAKLPDFRFHDTRHHFASMLVQGGVDLNTVRELLGHADLKLTLRYAYLAPHNTANAVAVLDAPNNVIPMPTPETAESTG